MITDKEVMSLIQNNVDNQATEIAKSRVVSIDRCMYCKMMFDGFCGKAKKFVKENEFYKEPYKPEWCPGRVPDYMYHD